MFAALKHFLADLAGPAEADAAPLEDPRVATAALMIQLVGVDGTVTEAERSGVERLLAAHYGLDPAATAELAAAARAADEEAVDLYGFTSLIKRRVDRDGRLAIVERLWEVVLLDGTLHEFEDNLVWRIAELLDIGTRDRVWLRRKVVERHGLADRDD
jgi:uncharacterized tellurite resistance protein B-like protein